MENTVENTGSNFTFDSELLEEATRPTLKQDTIVDGTKVSTLVEDSAEYNGETTSLITITYESSLGLNSFRCPVENAYRLQDLLDIQFNKTTRYGVVDQKTGVEILSFQRIREMMDNDSDIRFVRHARGVKSSTLAWLLLRHALRQPSEQFEAAMAPFCQFTKTTPNVLDKMQIGIRLSETNRETSAVFGKKVTFVKRGKANGMAKVANL